MITQVRALAPDSNIVKQQLVDYLNACTLVSAYVYGFTNATLAPLLDPPSWYSNFVSDFGVAKGHAMQWNSSIVPQLLEIPQSVSGMNNIVQSKFNRITDLLKQWQANPSDTALQQEILDQLDSLHQRVVSESADCSQLLESIRTYNTNTQNDYVTLKQGLDDTEHQLDEDKAEMERLQAEIQSLTDEIQKLNTKLTVAECGIGVSIFICLVGITVGVATGGASTTVISVGVSGLSASVKGTISMSKQIKADQAKITEDTAELDTLTQDVTVLTAQTQTLEQLCAANLQAQQALIVINDVWTQFAAALKELSKEIETMEADVTVENINGALAEFVLVQKEWNEIDEFAAQLAQINYEYDPVIQEIA
ncbi:HBL/NHE enterotoxin family protein [Tumebacillus lipolyticus]|uniref:HBL/NHE enterotoxin family protein n=1 Tax=Tumebacillus lipolyticus TaxID=1280370 RepID=A0ABW4ZX93_9BACL